MELSPERSVEDILAGRLHLVFGDQAFELPVLSRAENRRWRESLDARFQPLAEPVDDDDPKAVVAVMRQLAELDDEFLPFIYTYDRTGVLPPIEELDELARPHEILRAVLEVRAAANPTLAIAVALARAEAPPARSAEPPAPTSSPRKRTAGSRGKSKR